MSVTGELVQAEIVNVPCCQEKPVNCPLEPVRYFWPSVQILGSLVGVAVQTTSPRENPTHADPLPWAVKRPSNAWSLALQLTRICQRLLGSEHSHSPATHATSDGTGKPGSENWSCVVVSCGGKLVQPSRAKGPCCCQEKPVDCPLEPVRYFWPSVQILGSLVGVAVQTNSPTENPTHADNSP